MQSDFKLRRVERHNDTTEVVVVFYEGETSEQLEDGENITRYRRLNKIAEKEFSFNEILSDDEIIAIMKEELKKDVSRSPIPEL